MKVICDHKSSICPTTCTHKSAHECIDDSGFCSTLNTAVSCTEIKEENTVKVICNQATEDCPEICDHRVKHEYTDACEDYTDQDKPGLGYCDYKEMNVKCIKYESKENIMKESTEAATEYLLSNALEDANSVELVVYTDTYTFKLTLNQKQFNKLVEVLNAENSK